MVSPEQAGSFEVLSEPSLRTKQPGDLAVSSSHESGKLIISLVFLRFLLITLTYLTFRQILWPSMYLSYVVDPSVQENSWRDITAMCEKDKELRSKAQRLRRQLIDLERDAVAKGLLDLPANLNTPVFE